MSLVTCPECGSIFSDHAANCPTCTWQLPPERRHYGREGASLVERAGRFLRRITFREHPAAPRVPPLKRL